LQRLARRVEDRRADADVGSEAWVKWDAKAKEIDAKIEKKEEDLLAMV